MRKNMLYLGLMMVTLLGVAELAGPPTVSATPVHHECNDMWWIIYEQGCVGHEDYSCWHPHYFCPCGPLCKAPGT